MTWSGRRRIGLISCSLLLILYPHFLYLILNTLKLLKVILCKKLQAKDVLPLFIIFNFSLFEASDLLCTYLESDGYLEGLHFLLLENQSE